MIIGTVTGESIMVVTVTYREMAPVGQAMINHYALKPGDKVLDIGCGKGFQLFELTQIYQN